MNPNELPKLKRLEPLTIPALRYLVPVGLLALFLLLLFIFHDHNWSGKVGIGGLLFLAVISWLVGCRRTEFDNTDRSLLVAVSLRRWPAMVWCGALIAWTAFYFWDVWRTGPGRDPEDLVYGCTFILLALSFLRSAYSRIFILRTGIYGGGPIWKWESLESYEWTGKVLTTLRIWPAMKPSFWKRIGFRSKGPLVLCLSPEQQPAMIELLDQFMPGKEKPLPNG